MHISPSEEEFSQVDEKAQQAYEENRKTIESATKVLEFVHRKGPPILHLEDEDKGDPRSDGVSS